MFTKYSATMGFTVKFDFLFVHKTLSFVDLLSVSNALFLCLFQASVGASCFQLVSLIKGNQTNAFLPKTGDSKVISTTPSDSDIDINYLIIGWGLIMKLSLAVVIQSLSILNLLDDQSIF